MTTPVRRYLISNPSPAFGHGRRITFQSAAPAGSVVRVRVDGRPVRVHLTDTPLYGGLYAAEVEVKYL
ncbi:hypothetical protein ABZ468_07590 [Streptomyces sp. NPDC005708]|uniref:hypothetical protein n=1 Tax=Streptomyces sp. NPDC005708 TaxID=3154564 RepID=UPI0033EDF986